MDALANNEQVHNSENHHNRWNILNIGNCYYYSEEFQLCSFRNDQEQIGSDDDAISSFSIMIFFQLMDYARIAHNVSTLYVCTFICIYTYSLIMQWTRKHQLVQNIKGITFWNRG